MNRSINIVESKWFPRKYIEIKAPESIIKIIIESIDNIDSSIIMNNYYQYLKINFPADVSNEFFNSIYEICLYAVDNIYTNQEIINK